jgi:REP element-mobilizing transposase RayT
MRAALIVLALGAAVLPIPAALVERLYSTWLYPALQPTLTTASNHAPFALFDAAIVGVVALWLGLAVRDVLIAPLRGVLRVALRTMVWSATLYLIFLVAWGLNYRRVHLVDTVQFDASAVTDESVQRVAGTAVEQMNALSDRVHLAGWPPPDLVDPALAAAFQRTLADLGRSRAVVIARPKFTALDWYFRRAAVDGMTDPFFLETLVARDLLPFERPFVVAHEWSHLAGIADEGDANFVGWLTCVHGPPVDQYSGWLFVYGELAHAMNRRDRAAIVARLGPGPRADLRAVSDRFTRNVSPAISAAGWRVYDSYLKANRVEAGAASYAEVVRLVTGVRFGAGWRPDLKR